MKNKNTDQISFVGHLTELRSRLVKSVLAFIVGMGICFTVWNPIFNFLTHPICGQLLERGQDCGLILIKLQEGFFVAIRISLLGGLILSFPVIAGQLWRFVAPGLYKNEKSAFLPFILASPAMFFLGSAFAFYIVIPLAFDFFLGFQQIGSSGDLVQGESAGLGDPGITFQGSVAEYLNLILLPFDLKQWNLQFLKHTYLCMQSLENYRHQSMQIFLKKYCKPRYQPADRHH